MRKLISRGELIRRLNVLYDTTTLQRTDEITKAFLDFRFLIMNAPTVEAKEVVHAKWIDGCCSNCGAYIPTDSLWDYISEKECNFCYSCGCDMRTSAE